jgi:hypothetical protein
MKKPVIILSSLVVLALLGRVPIGSGEEAKPSTTAKEKKVRRLLEVSNAGGLGKQVMGQMLDAFENQPGLPAGFIPKFKEVARPGELVDLCIPVYMKHLDEADIESAIAYYETPAARRFVEKQSLIVKECMQLGQKWGQDTAIKVLRSLDKGEQGDGGEEGK